MTKDKSNLKVARFLEAKSTEFKDHANTVLEFNKMLIGGTVSGLDRELLSVRVTELLYGLLEQWSCYNNTVSQWLHAEWKDFGDIIFVHAYDESSRIGLHIGMNKDGFYLQMGEIPTENLPKMPNDFWTNWLRLSELGDLSLTEEVEFDADDKKRLPYLFQEKPGSLFQFMRSITASPILYEFLPDLGDFCMDWAYNKYSIIEVLANGCLAFELMHSMIRQLGKDGA